MIRGTRVSDRTVPYRESSSQLGCKWCSLGAASRNLGIATAMDGGACLLRVSRYKLEEGVSDKSDSLVHRTQYVGYI